MCAGVENRTHPDIRRAEDIRRRVVTDKPHIGGCKTRAVEFNTSQRCASHIASGADIRESVAIGKKAVEAALHGVSGHMMNFIRSKTGYKITIGSVDVAEVANAVRRVPDEFITPSGNNVTDKCLDYLRPLIEGEVRYRTEAGLPVHFKI